MVATPPETSSYTSEYLYLIQYVMGVRQVPKMGHFRPRNGAENDAKFQTIQDWIPALAGMSRWTDNKRPQPPLTKAGVQDNRRGRFMLLYAARISHFRAGDLAGRGRPDRPRALLSRRHPWPAEARAAQRGAARGGDCRGHPCRQRAHRRLAAARALDWPPGVSHCRRPFAVLDCL